MIQKWTQILDNDLVKGDNVKRVVRVAREYISPAKPWMVSLTDLGEVTFEVWSSPAKFARFKLGYVWLAKFGRLKQQTKQGILGV